jgi:signal transduction histidine kinase
VDQVLAAARAEAPTRPHRIDRTELPALLASCIAEIRSRHGLPDQALRLEVNDGVRVRGDATELGLVFRNLLENAVKYAQGPVDVQVAVRGPEDGRVSVEISDRGIGIPRRELRRIFERFYRVGRDVQRQVAGLGLGLFIVRGLLRRQGGRVVARSEGAGQGSRFVVTLRAAPPVAEEV